MASSWLRPSTNHGSLSRRWRKPRRLSYSHGLDTEYGSSSTMTFAIWGRKIWPMDGNLGPTNSRNDAGAL